MNPDYIPPEIGYPVAAVLWLVLLGMVLHTRWKLNKALNERPTLKIHDGEKWIDAGKDLVQNYTIDPKLSPKTQARIIQRETARAQHRAVNQQFYDQEKEAKG